VETQQFKQSHETGAGQIGVDFFEPFINGHVIVNQTFAQKILGGNGRASA
jgi:hypothetical protein